MISLLQEPFATCLNPFAYPEEKQAALGRHSREIDWKRVSHTLGVQRLQGMAWQKLNELSTAFPGPPEAERLWKLAYHGSRAVALRRLQSAGRLLGIAEENGIPVMVIKGPALVERAYAGDYGLRPFGDIDIAVLPEHVKPLLRLLNNHFSVMRNIALDFNSPSMELSVDGVPIELHWNLAHYQYAFPAPERSLEMQRQIWDRSVKCEAAWGRFRAMSAVDMAHFVAWHAVIKHDLYDRPLAQILDFLLLFKAFPDLTGNSLRKLSQEAGIPTSVEALSYAACEVFELDGKCPAVRELADSATRIVRGFTLRQLRRSNVPPITPTLKNILVRAVNLATPVAAFMDGSWTRLAFARQLVIPSRGFLSRVFSRKLTAAQYGVYLFLHPFLLVLLTPTLLILMRRQLEDAWKV